MNKSYKNTKLTFREFCNLKKLLLSRDLELIQNGVFFAEAVDDSELYDLLLDGLYFHTGSQTVVAGPFFDGTAPARVFHNTAMFGILKIASKYPKWDLFLKQVVEVNAKCLILDYLDAFKYARKISINTYVEICNSLNLNNLIDFYWSIDSGDDEKSNGGIDLSFNIFNGCENLQSLIIHNGLFTMGMDGIEKMNQLKHLELINIKGSFNTGIRPLARCLKLNSLKISTYEDYNYDFSISNTIKNKNIISLDGIENLIELKSVILHIDTLQDTKALMNLSSLEEINISSKMLGEYNPPIECLNLRHLELRCRNLNILGSSTYNEIIENVNINAPALEHIPGFLGATKINCFSIEAAISDLAFLSEIVEINELVIHECLKLRDISGLTNIERVGQFSIKDCRQLIDLHGMMKSNITIQNLEIARCAELVNLNGIENAEIVVKKLYLDGCRSLMSIEALKNTTWDRLVLSVPKFPKYKAGLQIKDLRLSELEILNGIEVFNQMEILDLKLSWPSDTAEDQKENPHFDFTPLENLTSLKTIRITSPPPCKRVSAFWNNLHCLWPISLSVFRKFEFIQILDIENHFRILDFNTIDEVVIDCIHIHRSEYSGNLPPNVRNVFSQSMLIKSNDKKANLPMEDSFFWFAIDAC